MSEEEGQTMTDFLFVHSLFFAFRPLTAYPTHSSQPINPCAVTIEAEQQWATPHNSFTSAEQAVRFFPRRRLASFALRGEPQLRMSLVAV